MTADGRQVAAARALAGLTVRQLAELAGTTKRIVSKIENGGPVHVSEGRRPGHVSTDLWGRITDALAGRGVELIEGGVRWLRRRT